MSVIRSDPGTSMIGAPSVESLLTVARKSPESMPEVVANLDALRALAVMLVLLDHVLDAISRMHPAVSFHPYDWAIGRLGVLLFFVHTSLVLNFSMVRLKLRGLSLMRSFLIRRTFRLYPLSLLCVALVLLLKMPLVPWERYVWMGWGNALSNFALTTNLSFSQPVLGPLWSLPIEAQMYIALPIIFMILGPDRKLMTAAGLWLLAAAVAIVQPSVSGRLNVIEFAPHFMAGVLAFALSGRVTQRLRARYWIPFLIVLVATYLLAQRYAEGMYSTLLQWAFSLVVGLLLFSFLDSRNSLLNKAVHLIAKYSYGMYLFHCMAIWIACFELTSLPEVLQWPLSAALAISMSVAAFHVIEQPAIALGARIAGRTFRQKEKAVLSAS